VFISTTTKAFVKSEKLKKNTRGIIPEKNTYILKKKTLKDILLNINKTQKIRVVECYYVKLSGTFLHFCVSKGAYIFKLFYATLRELKKLKHEIFKRK
jgi:hypothetical protein